MGSVQENNDALLLLASHSGLNKDSDSDSDSDAGSDSGTNSNDSQINTEKLKQYYDDVKELIGGDIGLSFQDLSKKSSDELKGLNDGLIDELKGIIDGKKDEYQYYFVEQTTTEPIEIDVFTDGRIEDLIKEHERCKNSPTLVNAGATCWLASVLQLLYAISPSLDLDGDINTYEQILVKFNNSQHSIICDDKNKKLIEFSRFTIDKFKELEYTDNFNLKTLNLYGTELLSILTNETNLPIGGQQDAEEAIRIFFNSFYDCLFLNAWDKNEDKRTIYKKITETKFEPFYTVDTNKTDKFYATVTEKFLTTDNLEIDKENKIMMEYMLQLNIFSPSFTTIQECYEDTFKLQKLENSFIENKQGESVSSIAKIAEVSLSDNIEMLVCQLLRFIGTEKNPQSIDITKLIINGKHFIVKGCLYHSGGIRGGHYVYIGFKEGAPDYVKNDASSEQKYEDLNFPKMKVNENNTYLNPEEIKKNAYVILYQRDYVAEKKARIESKKEIVAYDFDGVVHTLMAPDQEADLFGGSHKHPHDLVGKYFTKEHKEKDAAMFLVPHINMTTINDMLQEQNKNKNIIAIVTANPFAKTKSGKDKILQLLDYFGIEIDTDLIECSQGVSGGKNEILTKLDPIKFVDDTYSHIKDAQALLGSDKKLDKVVLSIPYYAKENNREGKYYEANEFAPSNLNISFSDFKGSTELKENEVTPDKAYKKGIVTLLSYNVYYQSYNGKFYEKNGKMIVEFINNLKPDIMFLCEAGWLCKGEGISVNKASEIEWENYGAPESSAFFVKDGTSWEHNGSLLYWNSKMFERANDKVGKCDIKYDKLTKGDSSNSRPGISVRLKHKETGKHIVVIGVHLDHMKSDSKDTNDKFRGIIKDAINYLLTEVGYVDDDQVLLMGDFNEYYGKDGHNDDTLEVKDKLTLTLKQDKDTCCGVAGEVDHPSKNSLQYKWRSDLLYTNIESMVTDVYKTNTDGKLNSDHSDHYPILGFFDPTDEVKTKTNGGGDTLQDSEMYSFF